MTSEQESQVRNIISIVAERPIAWSKNNWCLGKIDYEAELIFRMSVEYVVGCEVFPIPDLHALHTLIQQEYPEELFEVDTV